MTTELEMPTTTASHRGRLDDMVMRSSLLSNAAHTYMSNSSCQVLLANDPHNVDVPMPMMNEYQPLFEAGHQLSNFMQLQNVHAIRPELEGNCTLDYPNNYINVDNVPTYYSNELYNPSTVCNNFISIHDHQTLMKLQPDSPGGIRAEMLDHPLSWASFPYNDTKAHQPPLFVSSYLMDDTMTNDNLTISSLLSSVQPFNNTNQHFSPLNLNHIQNNIVSSSSYPLNVSQLNPHIDETEVQVLDAAVGPARWLQALFEDGSFADGQFVSAFFSDNDVGENKDIGKDETAFDMGGRSNNGHDLHHPASSALIQRQPVPSGEVNAGSGAAHTNIIGSSDGNINVNMEESAKRESSTSCSDGSDVDAQPRPASCSLNPMQYQINKRAALTEGDQGPARKRTACTSTSSTGSHGDAAGVVEAGSSVDEAASPHHNVIKGDKDIQTASPPSTSINAHKNKNIPTKSAARANKQSTACDPQSVAARHRRERISERLKILQELVPNGSKVDIVTMLEKAINYVKFLQLQVKVLTTDEYWPNSQKLNQPHEMNLLNLLMSKAKDESTINCKRDKIKEKTSKP